MNRHSNPKVPFGAETGPPPMMHDGNFIQSNNEWISRSEVVNGTRVADLRQSQNSEGIQSVDSSMENPDGYYQGLNALLNLDISASNFMKAMNFETMAGSDENEDERGDFEPDCDALGEQYNEQPSLEQHSMDMSIEIQNDLAEQQQAIEQAKLLHRFKQFREWQQQQQDLLMAQQQQQLLQLRGEQERVQRMIAQQRQMQWGGVNQKHYNKGNDIRSPPKVKNVTTKMASPRRSDPKLHSTIPHTATQGEAATKKTTQEQTDQEIKPAAHASTRIHMVNGRPAPVLPERPVTPDEYKERGNPNLDSDSNTVLSYDTMNNEDDEDGIYSIPDNLPETSIPQQPPKMASQSNLLVNGQGFPSMNSRLQEGRPNVSSQPLQPNGGLFEQAQQMQLQLLSQLAAQNGLTFPNHIMPNNTMQNGGFNLPILNSGQQSRGLHPGFLQNLLFKGTTGNGSHDTKGFGQTSTQHVPNTQGLEVQDEYILQRSKLNSAKNRSPPKQKHTRLKRPTEYEYHSDKNDVSAFNQKSTEKQINIDPGDCTGAVSALEEEEDDWEEVEEEEDDQNDEQYEEEEDEDGADKTQVAIDEDERPIEGIGTKKKTFEELLEEELRKEEERMKGGHNKDLNSQQTTENSGKRPFLKRGEGIARFNVPNSARTKNRKSSVKGQRQTHSAPASGRSDTRVKTTPTIPRKSRAEKNSSAPRKIINPNKSVDRQNGKAQLPASNTQNGLQKKGIGSMNNMKNKPVPPAEPKKMKTRAQLNKNKQASPKQVSSSPPMHVSDTDSVGEISFQKRIKSKAKEEEFEADELEEFEILEELADDDVSFISNVSIVKKVVTHLKEAKNGIANEQLVKQQIHKPKQMSHQQQEMKMLHHLQQRKQKQEELAALNAKLKSVCKPSGNFVYETGDRLESIEESAAVLDYRLQEDDSRDKVGTAGKEPKAIPQRKVVSLAARHPSSDQDPGRKPSVQDKGLSCLQQVIDFSDSESDVSDNDDDSETDKSEDSDQSDNEEENDAFVVKNIQLHAKNHDTNDRNNNENFAAQNNVISFENNNRNNRTSVTTGSESSRSSNVLEANSQSNSDRGPTPVSNNLSSSGGSSTLKFDAQNKNAVSHTSNVTSNGSEEPKDVNQYPPSNGFDFGDEEEWGDTSHNEDTNTTLTETDTILRNASPMDGDGTKKSAITKTKVQSSNAINGNPEEAAQRATPPPTSKLVSRLFPNLRTESNKQQKPEQIVQQQQFEVTKQTVVSEGVQSKALRDKLMELETEIEKFRSENVALTKLRKEREEGLSKLHKEMEEFQKQKEAELKRLNDFRTEETKKLKKERKLFDQYQKAARAIPDKKEREEIENLKKQVTDLQDEMKRKEQRWTSSTTRLRDRIETLETENRELKEETRLLEKKRLEAWQQKEAEKKSAKAAVTSNPLLKKEDSRKNALAPTPQQQAPKLSDRDNALRLSSNMEELKAAMGGLSVKELDDSVLSTEAEDQEQSFESKTTSPVKGKDAKTIPRKKALVFNISNTVDRGDGEYEENTLPDGKIEKVYSNGSREILFPNGTRKQISSDGQSIIVSFFNGDVKQIMPDQRVVYYYSEAQTTHTTYPDGLEILQFPNNQVEKHYPDGTREISFPDHTIKYLFPSGVEESIFEDGTVIRVEKNGDKTMEFPNGQREVHTVDYKRREYPDGTVKTVYPDGKQETRYSSGRIRIKDKEGNIIVDKRV